MQRWRSKYPHPIKANPVLKVYGFECKRMIRSVLDLIAVLVLVAFQVSVRSWDSICRIGSQSVSKCPRVSLSFHTLKERGTRRPAVVCTLPDDLSKSAPAMITYLRPELSPPRGGAESPLQVPSVRRLLGR